VTISVPAGETVEAVFDDMTFIQGNQRFNIRIEVAGAETSSVDSISLPFGDTFSLEYYSQTESEGESIWMTLLIVVLGVLVVVGGVKTARSSRGGKF